MTERDDTFDDVRVLVLDDNRNFQNLLRTMLRHIGFRRIDLFSEPAEARRHAVGAPVDLAFVDLVMPGESGLDWVRAARRTDRLSNPEMAIVMVTGHSDKRIVEAAIDAGADGFLVKPLSPDSLRRHVATTLKRPFPYVRSGDGYYGPDLHGRRRAEIVAPIVEAGASPRPRREPARTVPGLDVALRETPAHVLDTMFLD
ncbi:response regulator [Siculibacillus lacustris]|uniref:Response regulator n=1 Tax=Siculibacillus lacustris TaxID=1549641 RepID=A0A4Q9VYC3_9HYPH|nr:response regulator [Siculibacillus lacustris]TBW41012.1 response regulator [Siculibacillus lacustris]